MVLGCSLGRRGTLFGALLALVLATVVTTSAPSLAASSRAVDAPDGVLFYPSVIGLLPALKAPHFCSASVVQSKGHDLVITAAHCVYGIGATIEFAPGFNGSTPHGVWQVSRIYVEPAWEDSQNPAADVAFLQIAPRQGRQIEDVVGARPLNSPTAGASAAVSGFPLQSSIATTCTASLYLTQGYPSVACPNGGMTDGVSGGAWVQKGAVVGVVGGLEQGGCSADIAYSTPFNTVTRELLARAEADGPGNLVLPGFLANSCT